MAALAAAWMILVALLEGCATQAPAGPEPEWHPVLPAQTPWPELEEPAPAPPVAVVLSAETPAYRHVADALGEGRWRYYLLDEGNGDRVLTEVQRAGHRRAIAIGHQALALLSATDLEVAYCQVFDPVTAGKRARRGVAPLPDFDVQFEAWRQRQPTLRHVGLITGDGRGEVAQRIARAAATRALTVHHVVVRTDRELLYVFRRMVPEIQGFLLYPDTRILSPAAIRELLGYARKHDVWVLTYNRPVYDLGAALLVSADPGEVARQVVAVLDGDVSGPDEAPLRRVLVETAGPTADGG